MGVRLKYITARWKMRFFKDWYTNKETQLEHYSRVERLLKQILEELKRRKKDGKNKCKICNRKDK